MAIKLIKKAQTTVMPVVPVKTVSDYATEIDELGKLQQTAVNLQNQIDELTAPLMSQINKLVEKQSAALAKTMAKYAELKEAVVDKIVEDDTVKTTNDETEEVYISGSKADPDTVLVLNGTKYRLEMTKMGNERVITDKQAAADCIGEDTFWATVTIPLGAIDKYTTPEEQDTFIRKQRTARKFSKVEKIP